MSSTSVAIIPGFVEGKAGNNFRITYRKPQSSPKSVFVIVPPFAEEMNKSRRMLSRLAQDLAEQGYEAILPDLYGTGDSEGDFEDASWEVWCEDILAICRDTVANGHRLNFIAVRAGALLVFDLLSKKKLNCHTLILWQPVVSGDAWLTQFLRLKLAADMVGDSANKETTKNLKSQLKEGYTVEVAGYVLSSKLANGIGSVNLKDVVPSQCDKVYWMELVSNEDKPLLPVSKKILEKWQDATEIHCEAVVGQAFWSATEIVDADNLLLRTKSVITVSQ